MASPLSLSRKVPLEDSYDVVVCGAGPAGCAAATAAGRTGARVLLVEAGGCLGGMGTAGLVPAWCPFSDQKGNFVYAGIAREVFLAAKKGLPHVPAEKLDWHPINAEHLKRVYDDLVLGAGVTVRFFTQAAGVEMSDGGRIDAVLLASKAGLTAVRAKIYVDATGDGDVCAWAGAAFEKGHPETGELQPATHCFVLSNVDEQAMQANWMSKSAQGSWEKRTLRAILESGRYPLIRDPHFCHNFAGPRTMGFNAGHLWDVDNTDLASVSAAMVAGRKLAAALRDALAEFAPNAFGNAYLAQTGALMGVRETRRIMGDYVLSLADYLARRSFEDEVARNNYWVDVHTAKAEIQQARVDTEHVVHRYEHYQPGESHGIPYRCLTPKGLSNVLVAGRPISVDRVVFGSTRVMPTCLVTGQAAGEAAAMAAKQATPDVRAVDVADLRRRLREAGAFLSGVPAHG